jgi:hemerythrin
MLAFNPATMATGVAEIDTQHQELIKKLNELFERMKKGEGAAGLKDLLDFLGKYAQWHFGREEGCMTQHQCPVAAANKNAHAEFIKVFTAYRGRLEKEGATPGLAFEIQQQLTNWLNNHIVRIDTKLKECVGKTQPAGAAAR